MKIRVEYQYVTALLPEYSNKSFRSGHRYLPLAQTPRSDLRSSVSRVAAQQTSALAMTPRDVIAAGNPFALRRSASDLRRVRSQVLMPPTANTSVPSMPTCARNLLICPARPSHYRWKRVICRLPAPLGPTIRANMLRGADARTVPPRPLTSSEGAKSEGASAPTASAVRMPPRTKPKRPTRADCYRPGRRNVRACSAGFSPV